jgi:hypothetical protein
MENTTTDDKTPRQKWESLKQSVIQQITEIDKETPWQDYEPEWWLEMMNIQKLMRGQRPIL